MPSAHPAHDDHLPASLFPGGHEGPRPAGAYAVETEEGLLQSLTFPAYRCVSTTITRETARTGTVIQALSVGPRDLADARSADGP